MTVLHLQGTHHRSLLRPLTGTGAAVAAIFVAMGAVGAPPDEATLTVDSSTAITQALKEDRDGLATKGGTLLLAPGNYGPIVLNGIAPANTLTLKAVERHAARFTQIKLVDARNIAVEGVAVIANTKLSEAQQKHLPASRLFAINGSKNVLVEDIYVSSAQDTSGWTVSDWRQTVRNGIYIRSSSYVTVRNSVFEHLYNAITDYQSSHDRIENNTVRNFAADAIRAVGHYGVVKGNTVADCITINNNHDDAIQSWSSGPNGRPGRGELVGLRILNNTIVQSTGPHPLRCGHMQGVGFFDGFWRDLVIEGNKIEIDHWHGISVYGAKDAIIRGNVVNYRQSHASTRSHKGPKDTWIRVGPHKDGRPSERVIVEDNQALRFNVKGEDVVMRRNGRPR